MLSILAHAQTGPPLATNSSPISQPLIREGTLAVKLAGDLKLGITEDEAEAEDLLSSAGIVPRNGWIADYPVTPDIVGELEVGIAAAATGGRINLSTIAALQALQTDVTSLRIASDSRYIGKLCWHILHQVILTETTSRMIITRVKAHRPLHTMLRRMTMHTCMTGFRIRFGGQISGFRASLY